MNFVSLTESTAEEFERTIQEVSTDLEAIPTEDFGWTNHRWSSRQFRLAHVERFQQPRFSVLHTVIFPYINDPSPIFGFDIIASDTKATGVFFDFSPTVEDWGPIMTRPFQEPRDRPEWGTIFSDHWVACRPNWDEAVDICQTACVKLKSYIEQLNTRSTNKLHDVVRAQNNYSLQQRKNEHTTRVILKILGDQRGQHFVNNILFPTI